MLEFKSEHTVRVVQIKGTPAEMMTLLQELQGWTPTGGWSNEAEDLFDALSGDTGE